MIMLWQSHRAQSLVEVPEGAKDALRGEVNNYALLPSQCKCTIHTLERLSRAWLGDEVATSSLAPPGSRLGPSPNGGLVSWSMKPIEVACVTSLCRPPSKKAP